jgi:DNA-directed RNA polymerase subunit omega
VLRPSYSDLLDVLHNDPKTDQENLSRYSIVVATAKRARKLISGATPFARAESDKSVSVAINEIAGNAINIVTAKN